MATFGGTNPFDRQNAIPGVKNIIAIGAGKGGVGKSTISTNLALALHKQGLKVGLLDADIYGPSIPRMMGLADKTPNLDSNKKIHPLEACCIKTMSIGYLIEPDAAVIWRGPMLFKAIEQFLRDVVWGELDVLLVDLPPGTGDVQLSLVQKVPLTGAVVVSTPQDMALIDVKRCIDMFKRVKVPILGIVENMAHFVCPHCEKSSELFSMGSLHQYCAKNDFPLLGQIPFNPQLGYAGEVGNPLLEALKGTKEESVFVQAAQNVSQSLEM